MRRKFHKQLQNPIQNYTLVDFSIIHVNLVDYQSVKTHFDLSGD
jgi:hypothetical protein